MAFFPSPVSLAFSSTADTAVRPPMSTSLASQTVTPNMNIPPLRITSSLRHVVTAHAPHVEMTSCDSQIGCWGLVFHLFNPVSFPPSRLFDYLSSDSSFTAPIRALASSQPPVQSWRGPVTTATTSIPRPSPLFAGIDIAYDDHSRREEQTERKRQCRPREGTPLSGRPPKAPRGVAEQWPPCPAASPPHHRPSAPLLDLPCGQGWRQWRGRPGDHWGWEDEGQMSTPGMEANVWTSAQAQAARNAPGHTLLLEAALVAQQPLDAAKLASQHSQRHGGRAERVHRVRHALDVAWRELAGIVETHPVGHGLFEYVDAAVERGPSHRTHVVLAAAHAVDDGLGEGRNWRLVRQRAASAYSQSIGSPMAGHHEQEFVGDGGVVEVTKTAATTRMGTRPIPDPPGSAEPRLPTAASTRCPPSRAGLPTCLSPSMPPR